MSDLPAQSTALLVTDEPTLRHCLRFILHGMQLTVECAEDAVSARAMAASNSYSLVLIDLDALGAGGFALCRTLSQENRSDTTPSHIAVISLRKTAASRAKAFAMGAEIVLHKPFQPTALREQLGAILDDS